MRINVLNKGDKVISVTNRLIAIQRKNGEVDIIPFLTDKEGMWINTENIVTVGFENNTVESEVINGVVVTNF